jgi:hypothetical protein
MGPVTNFKHGDRGAPLRVLAANNARTSNRCTLLLIIEATAGNTNALAKPTELV